MSYTASNVIATTNNDEYDDIYCICDFETTGLSPENSYPIEIACILTDTGFNVLSIFRSLIRPDFMLDSNMVNWWNLGGEAEESAKIHKIPFELIRTSGVSPKTVVHLLNNVIHSIKFNNRCILISDCSKFEHGFMKKLWGMQEAFKYPFHYSVWDTSLLFKMVGVNEESEMRRKHRALPDAFDILKCLTIAKTKLKNVGLCVEG